MTQAAVVFTLDELWTLQASVRHEMAQQEAWRYPPVSLELNEQIAEALLMCEEHGETEAALLLTRADCLAIDATVQQQSKGPSGNLTGKAILLKSFRARAAITGVVQSSVEEPERNTGYEQFALRVHQEAYYAEPHDNPNDNANHVTE